MEDDKVLVPEPMGLSMEWVHQGYHRELESQGEFLGGRIREVNNIQASKIALKNAKINGAIEGDGKCEVFSWVSSINPAVNRAMEGHGFTVVLDHPGVHSVQNVGFFKSRIRRVTKLLGKSGNKGPNSEGLMGTNDDISYLWGGLVKMNKDVTVEFPNILDIDILYEVMGVTRSGIMRKISSWWNIDYSDVNSYEEWQVWLVSIRIQSKLKGVLECVYYGLCMEEAVHFASSEYLKISENSRHIRTGQLYKLWKNRAAAIASGNYLEEADQIIPLLYHENIIPFDSEDVYRKNAIIGTLSDYLSEERRYNFTWAQRLKTCLGVAKGLSYLHSGVGDHDRVILLG
ncbi:RNA-directed DNA polymerase, eukaryota [Tanacetum coccineum]